MKNLLYKSFEHKNEQKKALQKKEAVPTASIKEFPDSVQELIDRGMAHSLNRKSFLKFMGASLAMAMANCYKRPVEKIIPYVDRPKEHVPGIPTYYASVIHNSDYVVPVLAKTREGKPIKLEGLPEHPVLKGGMHAHSHAAIWDLYDPDRVKNALKRSNEGLKKIGWKKVFNEIKTKIVGKVVVLSKPTFSPSESKAIQNFINFEGAQHIIYDSIGEQYEIQKGEEASFRKKILPRYAFDKADLILSVGADFLGSWGSSEYYTKLFSSRRDPDANMNRLIVAEAMMSLTGANADQRVAIHSGAEFVFTFGIAHILNNKYTKNAYYSKVLADYNPNKVSSLCGIPVAVIEKIAEELYAHQGRSLVVASGKTAMAGLNHIAASLVNDLLNNRGKTIFSNAPLKETSNIASDEKLNSLIQNMKQGKIDCLIIDRANPVFELAQNKEFLDGLSKVKTIIHITSYLDETAHKADYVLGASHSFESWSDAYYYGTYSVAQPLIRPLFNTKSVGDIWLHFVKNEHDSFYKFIKESISPKYNTSSWNKLLSDGYSIKEPVKDIGSNSPFSRTALANVTKAIKIYDDEHIQGNFRLNLYKNIAIRDGSGGNISFRQELPDPVTKVTWGNYVAVSVKDAKKRKWHTGDVVKVTSSQSSTELPVFIQPGLKEGSLAIALGYGHTSLGEVAKNVGTNAVSLGLNSNHEFITTGILVKVEDTDKQEAIATTQRHHEIPSEDNRGIVNNATWKDFKKNRKAGQTFINELVPGSSKNPGKGLYKKHVYSGYRWGMNIDLSKCTGCSACVVSCYSENNIPAVGKEEVLVGREMSWLRIDRYYQGNEENPEVMFQPVMCQHCENAPCENVCPVVATNHSSEGLNDIAYNRCIGTRYCANNCPYKVRRFNWFENWKNLQDPAQFSLNPDVTVRSRGVIEKCSFCVQRIADKRQTANLENRKINDNEVKTACQQGCPAEAISFGNINDSSSIVSKKQQDQRAHKVLIQTNVQPAVTYMNKIKNQA